jgi:hypothetical protein
MQYIQRFNLKPRKSGEFRDWLKTNDQLLRNGQPEGWTYLGTWFTVRNFGHYDCEMRYELQEYAALGANFGSEALQKAFLDIMDWFAETPGETTLMKSAEEVIIMEGA